MQDKYHMDHSVDSFDLVNIEATAFVAAHFVLTCICMNRVPSTAVSGASFTTGRDLPMHKVAQHIAGGGERMQKNRQGQG